MDRRRQPRKVSLASTTSSQSPSQTEVAPTSSTRSSASTVAASPTSTASSPTSPRFMTSPSGTAYQFHNFGPRSFSLEREEPEGDPGSAERVNGWERDDRHEEAKEIADGPIISTIQDEAAVGRVSRAPSPDPFAAHFKVRAWRTWTTTSIDPNHPTRIGTGTSPYSFPSTTSSYRTLPSPFSPASRSSFGESFERRSSTSSSSEDET